MRIGELAERAGVTTKTVRFYEASGLLEPPVRTANGYRDCGDDALAGLEFIQAGQAIDLTLADLRTLVALRSDGRAPCREALDLLQRHLSHIDQRIASLRALRGDIRTLVRRAAALDPAECDPASVCHLINPGSCPCTAHRADGTPTDTSTPDGRAVRHS